MKVYVATDGEYSDYHIESVFLSKKEAEAYCALHECFLEEFDTDAVVVETDREPLIKWYARISNNTDIERMENFGYTFKEIEMIETERYTNIVCRLAISLPAKYDEQKVRKIIRDRIAIHNANNSRLL